VVALLDRRAGLAGSPFQPSPILSSIPEIPMKAQYPSGLTALGLLLASRWRDAAAQTEVGAQLDLFSAYVWRGVTHTNNPVAQPDLWISFPAGNASVTAGRWANIDVGQYDDPAEARSRSRPSCICR
jgi:hypothetical protein